MKKIPFLDKKLSRGCVNCQPRACKIRRLLRAGTLEPRQISRALSPPEELLELLDFDSRQIQVFLGFRWILLLQR